MELARMLQYVSPCRPLATFVADRGSEQASSSHSTNVTEEIGYWTAEEPDYNEQTYPASHYTRSSHSSPGLAAAKADERNRDGLEGHHICRLRLCRMCVSAG